MTMLRIILLGPQGSGKGTQAELLASKFDIPAISAGDLLRREIEQETEFSQWYKPRYARGELAPDEEITKLLKKRTEEPDAREGFVVDGYPRNRNQAELLERFTSPTHVIVLTLSDAEAVKRLVGRLFCKKCRRSYHVVYNPPRQQHGERWYCDDDRKELGVREDDKEKAIRARLAIYHKDTEPLIELYRSRGLVHEVNGAQSIKKVHEDIIQALSSPISPP